MLYSDQGNLATFEASPMLFKDKTNPKENRSPSKGNRSLSKGIRSSLKLKGVRSPSKEGKSPVKVTESSNNQSNTKEIIEDANLNAEDGVMHFR